MFEVYQHWDPLRVCIVGRAYPPEFYSFIENKKIRSLMERIATETEEDFQKLITVLESFGVEVLRPITGHPNQHIYDNKLQPPPVMPRDTMGMIGDKFFFDNISGNDQSYDAILARITNEGNSILYDTGINTATIIPLGKNLYSAGPISDPWDRDIWNIVRRPSWPEDIPNEYLYKLPKSIKDNAKVKSYRSTQMSAYHNKVKSEFPNHKVSCYEINAHIDGCFCPIRPGLILSLTGIQNYDKTFPGWEIIYHEDSNLASRLEFNELRAKNNGKWWLPGTVVDDEFIEFVETYLDRWTGFVEESVFDVNILMVDQNNAICSNFNDSTLEALFRHDVNPIKVNFRHRFFWDGGIHCITNDIYREGKQIDLGLPIFSP